MFLNEKQIVVFVLSGIYFLIQIAVSALSDAVDDPGLEQYVQQSPGTALRYFYCFGEILRCKTAGKRVRKEYHVIGKGVDADFIEDADRDSVHARGSPFFVASPAVEIPGFLHVDQADDEMQPGVSDKHFDTVQFRDDLINGASFW